MEESPEGNCIGTFTQFWADVAQVPRKMITNIFDNIVGTVSVLFCTFISGQCGIFSLAEGVCRQIQEGNDEDEGREDEPYGRHKILSYQGLPGFYTQKSSALIRTVISSIGLVGKLKPDEVSGIRRLSQEFAPSAQVEAEVKVEKKPSVTLLA